ncbi:Tetratricopeptide repeat protein 14 isoform X3 [Aphelenchoides fujianensis]|nr:Tetratricopeptide repeat protein 14 isoform X3 [Aphelenchoides fujianensis]
MEPRIPESLRKRFQRLGQPDVHELPLDDYALDNVPLLEEFADGVLSLHERAAKFFEDVRPTDRIAAQVRATSAVMIEVELLCTTARFRRNLEPLKLGRFKIMHDRTDHAFHSGDLLEVRVETVDDPVQRLTFSIDLEKAPLTPKQLPSNAAARRRQADGPASSSTAADHPAALAAIFGENADVCRLAANPSAVHVYGFPRRLPESLVPALRRKHPLRPPDETAESLREQQHALVAEMQIRRAGEYIRNHQNFEAIQCCNSALNVQPNNLDALLGRAIAANNMENFASAVLDLDRILKAAPDHPRARSIIDKVLVQHGEKLEEQKDFEAAVKQFERALDFAPTNADAQTALNRVRRGAAKNGKVDRNGRKQADVVDLTEDDEADGAATKNRRLAKRPDDPADDPLERKRRLAEFEKFKAQLAKRVKR